MSGHPYHDEDCPYPGDEFDGISTETMLERANAWQEAREAYADAYSIEHWRKDTHFHLIDPDGEHVESFTTRAEAEAELARIRAEARAPIPE